MAARAARTGRKPPRIAQDPLVDLFRAILREVEGSDPEMTGGVSREGLRETPARAAKAFRHYFSGYKQNPHDVLKAFEDGAEQYDEMVTQLGIPVWSTCEHHVAPFFGVAHIGYIPSGRVVGLSKLARLVNVFARRLQVQERLTQQIAQALSDYVSGDVAVILECRHSCMESRGVQISGTTTKTSAMLGKFRDSPSARAEFLSLIGK